MNTLELAISFTNEFDKLSILKIKLNINLVLCIKYCYKIFYII